MAQKIVNIEKFGNVSKYRHLDGLLIYNLGTSLRIEVLDNKITIYNSLLSSKDDIFGRELDFPDITDKLGNQTPEQLVDCWFQNDFFLANQVKTTPSPFATKMNEVGDILYIGKAKPGSLQAALVWQAQKLDESTPGETVVTWADFGLFSQAATDLVSLTYS